VELSRRDFVKASGILIFQALDSERGQQPHPKPFHYTAECVIYIEEDNNYAKSCIS
jgi:hypothetical protein